MVNLKTIPLSHVSFLFHLFIIQFLTIPQKSEHLYNKFENYYTKLNLSLTYNHV